MSDIKIASGRSNLSLSKKVAEGLGVSLADTSIKNFSDGEIWVKYNENVRGVDLFILQSTFAPTDNIFELLMLIDAAKELLPVGLLPLYLTMGMLGKTEKTNRESQLLQNYLLICWFVLVLIE